MSWFKVDDMLAFNAKVVTAGNEAMGLWVRAGSWCAAQLKGGFVPDVMANAMRSPLANRCDIDALVSAGLWHEVEGGYEFHDWDHYQPNAEQEREKRQKRSDAGKRGAEARWGDGNSHSNANGNRMANGDATAMPPSSPVQSYKTGDFDRFWSAYPKRVSKGAARKAWDKAMTKAEPSVVIAAAEVYTRTTDGTDPKFIKHPATWLNAEGWLDEAPARPNGSVRQNVVVDKNGVQHEVIW